MPRPPLGALLYLASTLIAFGQTSVTTDPVGFTKTSCLANSDTYLGIPFTRPPEFTGMIQTVSANTLTINGSPSWSNNQFVYAGGSQPKHYYVLIGNGGASNPKEGHIYPITANGSNTLSIDTSFDNLAGIVASTQLTVIPYWTPATIFPASDAGICFTPTTSPPTYQTLLRIPNYSAPGINQPYAAEYYFNNDSWQRVSPAGVGDDDPLLPDGYFVVRNANGAPTLPLTALGSVLTKKVAVPLLTSSGQQQDNAITMVRPVDVTLDATGLAPIDNSFAPGDQLLLFNNAQPGFDKPASGNYTTYTFNDGWRSTSDNADHSKDLVSAGSAVLVRKAAYAGARTFYSLNSATYVAETFLSPLAAVSRKSHNAAGTFDVNLPTVGNMAIECRTPAAPNSYQILFRFANPVTLTGATATPGPNATGSVSGAPVVNGNHVTVNLQDVSNAQRLTINLFGVSDGTVTNDFTVPMAVLIGDINASGRTDNGDAIVVRNASGSVPIASNFRADVNASGRVDNGDAIVVRNFSGVALPAN